MAGASWDDRQPTDWLASNGKWYPSSHYPRGWVGTALPPAPGHGAAASALATAPLRTHSTSQAPPQNRPPPRVKTASPSRDRDRDRGQGQGQSSGFSVAKTGRRVAQATVADQRDYAHKLSSGAPPPPPLGTGEAPTSPGRVRELPPAPNPPGEPSWPAVPNSIERSQAPPAPKTPAQNFEVIAGDLGKVLGGARKKIKKALDDAYEGQ